MRILLVKTSSLGDVIHNLPVVSDIKRHYSHASIDWCVEEAYADIPRLHPGVDRVIPVALRRWRTSFFKPTVWQEIRAFRRQLHRSDYDFVIDTQGLLKSALIARDAKPGPEGTRAGFCAETVRESIAARFYQRKFSIGKENHAIERNRRLVAAALFYPDDGELAAPPDYGIRPTHEKPATLPAEKIPVVLLTASSRDDKLWPDDRWIELGRTLATRGLAAALPAGNPKERARAERIAAEIPAACVMPPLSIAELAHMLANAEIVVGLDTGLTHLGAAVGTPTIAIFTATDPALTGIVGCPAVPAINLGGRNASPLLGDVLTAIENLLGVPLQIATTKQPSLPHK